MPTTPNQDLADAIKILEKLAYIYRKLNASSVIDSTGKLGGEAEEFLKDTGRSFNPKARPSDTAIEKGEL